MPYYLVQLPGGNLAQLFANSPEEARNIAGNRTGVSAGQVIVRQAMDSPFTNEFVQGTQPQTTQPQVAQPTQSPFNLQPPAGSPGSASGGVMSEESGLGRTGAFRRALQGRGIDLGTLAGGSVLGQQGQFEDVFDVLQALGRAPGGERSFETFAQGQNQPFAQALGLVQALGRGEFGQSGMTDQVRALLNPTTAEEIGGTARLGQAALRGQVGAFGSNPFLQGAIGRLPGEFAAQTQSQQAAMPFFQFLRRRVGI